MGKNEQEYEVEALIGKRRKKNSGSVQYRVLWKGYPKEQSTWEPEEHLENVQYMIDEFQRKIKEKELQQKKQTPPQPSIVPFKKISQQVPTPVQQQKRKQVPQKTLKKMTKDSDQDYTQQAEEEPQQIKPRGNSVPRGRPSLNRIQQEPKTIQRKIVGPVRNGVKPTNFEPQSPKEIKRPHSLESEIEKVTDIQEDTGFSSDEESESILEVMGMFVQENGKYGFSVYEKKNNRRVNLRRRQIIKRDPLALIKFYEKSINILS